jgi:hypothetical protein
MNKLPTRNDARLLNLESNGFCRGGRRWGWGGCWKAYIDGDILFRALFFARDFKIEIPGSRRGQLPGKNLWEIFDRSVEAADTFSIESVGKGVEDYGVIWMLFCPIPRYGKRLV